MRTDSVSPKVAMTGNAFRELGDKPILSLPEPSERVRLRNLFGVTQTTLAGRLGVTRRTVHAWESGKSEPTGDNRSRYADMLALWASREHTTGK